MNCEIGSSTSFEKIQKKHEAILIATGVYKSREINLNHNNSNNVVPALEYLVCSNRKGLKDNVKDFDNLVSKDIRFVDPFNNVKGVKNFKKIFLYIFKFIKIKQCTLGLSQRYCFSKLIDLTFYIFWLIQ